MARRRHLKPYPKDECGLFGIFGHPNAAELTYYGLFALQHRGQESAGIVSCQEDGAPFRKHIGMGLVPQVFNGEDLKRISGRRAIGHVRYSTTGSSTLTNAQPLVADCAIGSLAICHNGNLVNANMLREELEGQGSIFQTTVDSEVILHLLTRPPPQGAHSSLMHALRRVQGAFSLLIMTPTEIIALRDPSGFRPLSIGKLEGAFVFSSETCAFDLVKAEFIRDVDPGEVVVCNSEGLHSYRPFDPGIRRAFCIFEQVYFARPDSMLLGTTVSETRKRMGRTLARLYPVQADIVIPVPDSGTYAAQGYSEESGIPFEQAFVRNHYTGRTFIQPSQLIRDLSVRVKLNLIKRAVAGKRVVVVDDSIVRGTTARARVVNLREAGASEVHIRISCPPHRFACHYGIDFPDPMQLIANQKSKDQIREYLGADSLGYLDVHGMIKATGRPANEFCVACFTGDYPIPYDRTLDKFVLERRARRPGALGSPNGQMDLFNPISPAPESELAPSQETD